MRFISSLVVVVALVGGRAVALDDDFNYEQVQLQPDGTLVAHPKLAQTTSKDQLGAGLNELEFYVGEREGTPVSEVVAQLLYTAEDKSTEVVKGLTVNDLIAENSFNPLADCSEEAFKKRADTYYKSMPQKYGASGAPYAATVYSLKCLMTAANYCVTRKAEVVKAGVATGDFMEDLHQAYVWDNDDSVASGNALQDDVYFGFQSNVAVFLKKDINAARRGEHYRPEN